MTVEIYNGDCRDVLSLVVPDKSVQCWPTVEDACEFINGL